MIERIFKEGKEIILIGTAHISDKSVELVNQVIMEEKPDTVGVELCRQRFMQLKSGKKWQETNINEIMRSGRTYLFLINLLLSNMQRKLGGKVGVKPGSEMVAATKIAGQNNIPISLLDRNVTITLKRAFSLMGLLEKIKLIGSIVLGLFGSQEELTKEKIEELKRQDIMTELMNELSSMAPTVKRVLVDERDVYIANKIMRTPGEKIVAVVGAGHLEGIKRNMDKERNLQELETIPKKKSILPYLKYLVPVIFIAILGSAIYFKGLEVGLQIFLWWFLINGVLSALGVALARGHPLSIITAFLAAPFTSLHPAVAAGWFAALVETRMQAPKVMDFESLNALNSMGDFTKNRVTKILLVAAFANIGSTIGTVVALPYILSLLA